MQNKSLPMDSSLLLALANTYIDQGVWWPYLDGQSVVPSVGILLLWAEGVTTSGYRLLCFWNWNVCILFSLYNILFVKTCIQSILFTVLMLPVFYNICIKLHLTWRWLLICRSQKVVCRFGSDSNPFFFIYLNFKTTSGYF